MPVIAHHNFKNGLMAYLLLTVVYVITGKLGLMLALPPGYASPIFPPAGIAVAAVLIGGRSTLPWVFLGSLLLNVWVGYSASQQINAIGFVVATIIAVATMLQAAAGGWGLRRAIGYPTSLDQSGDVLRFLLLAPVICLTSATLSVSGLSLLGILAPASFATNWAAWWVGDTLGVVVMLPLVMIVAGEPRALWQGRIFTVAVPKLLVFSLFVMIFLKANQWEYADSLMEFRQFSQQAVNRVQNEFEEQEAVLEQTAALFNHDASDHITREEFHRFVQKTLLRFPMIHALEWASPVDATHRASFEAAQRIEIPGFEIREQNAAGQVRRADERSSFYPVAYVEPLAGNESVLGFDLATSYERRAALTEAVQRGTAVATPAVHLLQERQQQAGMLMLLAVDPRNPKAGTVLTVLRMGDFMDALLQDTRAMLYTRLIDVDEQKVIYDNFVPGTPQVLYEHTFNFGTRHYRLETAPTAAYVIQHHGWQSWSVLAAGVLGTGLLGALFLLGTGYTARVEVKVAERTRELKESKTRLQEAQHMTQIGNWELDIAGNILVWSDEIYHIFELDPATFGASYETFINAIHPEDRAGVDSAFAESVKNRTPYSIEHRLLFPDGRIKFVHEKGETFYDVNGLALRSAGAVQDITERKRVEETLRENESRLKDMFENLSSGVAVYRVSPDGQDFFFTAFNRAAERIDKLRREDLVGKNLSEAFPGVAEFGLLEVFRRVWKSGVAEHFPSSVYLDGRITGWRENYIYKLPNGEIVAIYDDVTKEKQAEEQIHHLAYYDILTGLPNRVLFTDRLKKAIATAKRSNKRLALIFIDLDKFKPVNDELGHDVGDLLLKEVAKRMELCVRETDTVSRIGGDEFTILLPTVDAEQDAMLVAEKVLQSIEQPFELAGQRIRISSSIGVAVYPEHGGDEKRLIKNADIAMYHAKASGRNIVKLYQPNLTAECKDASLS